MKIYKFWRKGNKNRFHFVAAEDYMKAQRFFVNELQTVNDKVRGKTLLKKNPKSKVDYLDLDFEKGIIHGPVDFEYFKGDKEEIKVISPNLQHFIRREVKKEVEKYFDERIPEFD